MTTTFKIRNGDVDINRTNGRPDEVIDGQKLRQDLMELLLIDTQTDNGFGAGLDAMVGQLPNDEITPGSINFSFSLRLRKAFQRFKQLQRAGQFGQRPLTELISRITFIRAEPDRIDARLYRFSVNVVTVAGDNVRLGGNINLTGTTQ